MHPAPLASSIWPDFIEGSPKAKGAVCDRQLRCDVKTSITKPQEHFLPACRAFTITGFDRQDFLVAISVGADDDQHTHPLALAQPDIEVNAVGPDIDEAAIAQRGFAPLLVLILPHRLQAGHG